MAFKKPPLTNRLGIGKKLSKQRLLRVGGLFKMAIRR